MSHWFDRASVRAADRGDAFTRRTAVKAAAAGAAAGSTLGSPLILRAAAQLSERLRESNCACQEKADAEFEKNNNALIGAYLLLASPIASWKAALVPAGLAGNFLQYFIRKVTCGKCVRNPSGSLGGGGGGGTPCRALGGVCPGPGPTCPPGTSPCADGLCCFGTDVCCSCAGVAQCCIVEVGCGCC